MTRAVEQTCVRCNCIIPSNVSHTFSDVRHWHSAERECVNALLEQVTELRTELSHLASREVVACTCDDFKTESRKLDGLSGYLYAHRMAWPAKPFTHCPWCGGLSPTHPHPERL